MVGPLSKTKVKPKTKSSPDFKDPKYKVGKKQKAANETNTAFRAKRVTLAAQSILSTAPSTPESVVIECLTRCRHYSAKKRVEAFQDLKRMDSVPVSLTYSFLSTCFSALIDEDAEVRKTLRPLLLGWMSKLPVESLSPFSEMIALQLRSGLSHVNPEVRKDLIEILRALLSVVVPVNGLIRRDAGLELLRSFCEQRLRLDLLDIVSKILSGVVMARDTHPSQWRLSQLNKKSIENEEVYKVLEKELKRLISAYGKDNRKRGEAASLALAHDMLKKLGVDLIPGQPGNLKLTDLSERPISKKGGSFAALLEDY